MGFIALTLICSAFGWRRHSPAPKAHFSAISFEHMNIFMMKNRSKQCDSPVICTTFHWNRSSEWKSSESWMNCVTWVNVRKIMWNKRSRITVKFTLMTDSGWKTFLEHHTHARSAHMQQRHTCNTEVNVCRVQSCLRIRNVDLKVKSVSVALYGAMHKCIWCILLRSQFEYSQRDPLFAYCHAAQRA